MQFFLRSFTKFDKLKSDSCRSTHGLLDCKTIFDKEWSFKTTYLLTYIKVFGFNNTNFFFFFGNGDWFVNNLNRKLSSEFLKAPTFIVLATMIK
jgi:hypothetical protein